MRVVADARIELLGLVQFLAGGRLDGPAARSWPAGLESRFGRWRRHPAVAAYRRAALGPGRQDAYGLILLFLTDPPRLEWGRDKSLLSASFIRHAGGEDNLERFLRELRDFARRVRFMSFYNENKPWFLSHKREGEKKIPGRDCLAALERYVGCALRCRYRIIWPLLYSSGELRSYIIPYPYQGAGVEVSGPFEAFTIAAWKEQRERWPYFLWAEPLYIPIEKLHAQARRQVYQPSPKDKECLVSTISWRLSLGAFSSTRQAEPGSDRGKMSPLVRALCQRLKEYENDRRRYPTLASFYPRLLEVLRRHQDWEGRKAHD